MNSVLAALRAQAVETVEIVNPDTGITHHREFFDEEKFAVLIIKECMAICISNALDDMDSNVLSTSGKCAFDINTYFGITQ